MKMTREHYKLLEKTINAVIEENGGADALTQKYNKGDFPRAHAVKDLQRRFCFDLFYLAMLKGGEDFNSAFKEYTDCNLYTALNRILPRVVRAY